MSEPWVPNIPYTDANGLFTQSHEFDQYKIKKEFRLGELIAGIGTPENHDLNIEIGRGRTFTARASGTLYVGPNEQLPKRVDNFGGMTVVEYEEPS